MVDYAETDTNWGSVPSTIDAVNAILNTGDYMLSASRNTVKITWGKTVLKPEITDGFTGYERYIRQGAEITPDLANVKYRSIRNNLHGGALYRQYFAGFLHRYEIRRSKVFLSISNFLWNKCREKKKVYEPFE